MKGRTKNGTNGESRAPRPVHRITRGKVEAAIWERSGRQGRFFQVSLSRPYQTQDGGTGSSESFSSGQCSDVAVAAIEAALWMDAQRGPRRRDGDYSPEGTEAEYDGDDADYEGRY